MHYFNTGVMEEYNITNHEMTELKQTIGFRVTDVKWKDFVKSKPNGCTSIEMIEFVKKNMDPPYKVDDLDEYMEKNLKAFVKFVRA